MTVFIQKGDTPMTVRQAVKRGLAHFNAQKQQFEREQGIVTDDPEYLAWAAQWVANNEINAANNMFNHQLAAYRAALSRLEQYPLAEGRPEITEEQPTGEFDPETGEALTALVVIQSAVDPLPAQVEAPAYDETTGEQTGVQMIPNPAIAQDNAEREQAAATIAAIPQEVKDFATAQDGGQSVE